MPNARTTLAFDSPRNWFEHTEQVQELTNPDPTQKSRCNAVQDGRMK